jgi:peptidoglycan/LPS O-acetylase OafA/YrhL
MTAPLAAVSRAPSAADRNGWIDCLRAVAALVVALFHLNLLVAAPAESAVAGAWRDAFHFGYLGVPVFFVISGYCIGATWLRCAGPADFAWRRGRRILPAYWASLALVAALALGFKLARGVNDVATLPSTPAAILATLALCTDPATSVKNMNWVNWSLVAEAAFYLVCGLLLLAPRLGPSRAWRLAGVHTLLCACALWPALPKTGPIFFVHLWPMFGLGAVLPVWRVAPAAGVTMATISALALVAELVARGPGNGSLLAAAITTVVLAAILPRPMPTWLRPLAWFGGLSYSLYLVHVPLGLYGFLRFLPTAPVSVPVYFGVQLLWSLLVGVAAWFFWRCFERPFLRA